MFRADECRAKALGKLDLAKLERRRRRSLTKAAEAWLYLAQALEHGEAVMIATPMEIV
jgi:hypothetical protein